MLLLFFMLLGQLFSIFLQFDPLDLQFYKSLSFNFYRKASYFEPSQLRIKLVDKLSGLSNLNTPLLCYKS